MTIARYETQGCGSPRRVAKWLNYVFRDGRGCELRKIKWSTDLTLNALLCRCIITGTYTGAACAGRPRRNSMYMYTCRLWLKLTYTSISRSNLKFIETGINCRRNGFGLNEWFCLAVVHPAACRFGRRVVNGRRIRPVVKLVQAFETRSSLALRSPLSKLHPDFQLQ